MTAQATEPTPIQAVDEIPVIEVDEAAETFPFKIAYRRKGERVVEDFRAWVSPPFSVYARFGEFDEAGSAKPLIPALVNECLRRLFLTALPEDDADRLLTLINGDADKVGVVTPAAIGGIIDVLRAQYFNVVPTLPGSQSGPKRAGSGSAAKRSAKASTSKRSR